MNTAARMESNGTKSKIHLSQESAELLMKAGKSSWIKLREDKINAKGKGELQTYWLDIGERSDTHSTDDTRSTKDSTRADDDLEMYVPSLVADQPTLQQAAHAIPCDRISRLVDWNVDVLMRLLKHIVSNRCCNLRHQEKIASLYSVKRIMLSQTPPALKCCNYRSHLANRVRWSRKQQMKMRCRRI